MKSITFKNILYSLFITLILTACGGGGGGNTTQTDTLTLSTTSSDPGQYITVSHNSIQTDTPVDIEFRGPDGYLISSKVINTSDGNAKVMVPPFVDGVTGAFKAGNVSVKIKNIDSQASLAINELPTLENMTPGQVMIILLEATIAEYVNAQNNLDLMNADLSAQMDISAAYDAISNQILVLTDIIDQIETTGELSIEGINGSLTLSPGDLLVVDQLLASSIAGISNELGGTFTSTAQLPVGSHQPGHTGFTEQQIRDMINNVISEAKRGVDGDKVLIGVVTIGVGAVGFFTVGPLAGVAAAAGVGLTYLAISHDFITAETLEKMSNAINQNARPAYDSAKKSLDSMFVVVTEWSSKIPGIPGRIMSVVSTGLTAKSTIEAGENLKCGNPPGTQSLPMSISLLDPAYQISETTFDFCTVGSEPGPTPGTGTFTVLAIMNAGQQTPNNSPTEQDIANADIQLSGNSSAPTINWSHSDTIVVSVFDNNFSTSTNPFLYSIAGMFVEDVPGTGIGHLITINSPVTYGNYSIPGTEPIEGVLIPSPALYSGGVYSVEIVLDSGGGAFVMFRVN